jgi:transposase-like protein
MTSPSHERWQPVEGYPYEVSTEGQVRRIGAGRCLAQTPTGPGYLQVTLSKPGAVRRPVYVHRLVLEVFVGPCPPRHEARHENEDRTDNRLANLAWADYDDPRPERKRGGRISEATKGEIRARRARGDSVARVAHDLGVSVNSVVRYAKGHVKPYRTTPERRAAILAALAEDGASVRGVARQFGVSPPTVARIRDSSAS